MVSFGQELQTTLDDVVRSSSSSKKKKNKGRGGGGIDASKFAIIQDLVDGDRIKSATKLAQELSDLSLKCVDKSQEMMGSMERGIDALPDVIEPFVENKMNKATSRGAKRGDPELPDVEGSVRELQTLVKDVETVNLFTVVKSGSAAFEGLRKNGELSKDMFLSIKMFADDVESVSGSFRDFKPDNSIKLMGKIKTVAKDAWRCLRLSGLMKVFAEKVGQLIQWIISLFQMASAKLGSIWGALANAKEVLGGCLVYVKESIRLCDESKQKSLLLRDTSGEIRDHLKTILQFRKSGAAKAMDSVRDLADGDEIILCITLGTHIDDMFTECVQQVITTIDKVDDAIRSMPDVLTQDVPKLTSVADDGDEDEDADGAKYDGGEDDNDGIDFDDDDEVERQSRGNFGNDTGGGGGTRTRAATFQKVDVGNDVRELEGMASGIEDASALTVIQRSAEGFAGVNDKIGTCGDMITTSRGFAETCLTSIDSFNNGEWDLQVASEHILELFEIRDAGKQMKEFVESVLALVRANIALMKAVRSKSKDVATPGGIGNLVESFASDIDLDDLKGLGEGIKKFGSLFKK